eukprot:IDg13415t1
MGQKDYASMKICHTQEKDWIQDSAGIYFLKIVPSVCCAITQNPLSRTFFIVVILEFRTGKAEQKHWLSLNHITRYLASQSKMAYDMRWLKRGSRPNQTPINILR